MGQGLWFIIWVIIIYYALELDLHMVDGSRFYV